jgi:Tfp pilus assembly protein PilN
MRVINLLPWREALYQRRRREFVIALLAIALLSAVWALCRHRNNTQDRREYDAQIVHLQAVLSDLERSQLSLLQKTAETSASRKKLQSNISQRMQQLAWQQRIHDWQLLAGGARISQISWHGDELLLRGSSEKADPLRALIEVSPHWQLQQIELNAQNRYQFLMALAVHDEGGL